MKSKVYRSQFLLFLVVVGLATAMFFLSGCSNSNTSNNKTLTEPILNFWIDSRILNLPQGPWRKVHLDFHNSKHVSKIGADFNADQWGDQLVSGNVDGIVVFAKDMHGLSYYPSEIGPVHPGLSFDMLDQQVKTCRERDIEVYAYYCTTWDHYLFDTYPEWRVLMRDGTDFGPADGNPPGWTALCLANQNFVDLMANQVAEFLSKYELDGVWLDMTEPNVPECYCSECIKQIKAEGNDPFDKEVQRAHKNKIFLNFHHRMTELVHTVRPGAQIDFNDIGLSNISERAESLDNIDVEALPTDPHWGYFYAPAQIRYNRNFGVPVYGMTGRFVSSWADFGGLKLPQQLDVELASLVANAARCDVGDQMLPNGILDPAVYHVIGKSFGRIKQLEPWLNQAAPVTEAALMISDIPLDFMRHPYIYGIAKLMIESHLQFDLVEPGQEWERYNLLVLPDEFKPNKKIIDRLHKYIEAGGSVIVSHHAGLIADTKQTWLEQYGFKYNDDSPFIPAYLVTEDGFIEDMPGYAYALYNGASQWEVQDPGQSLLKLGEPLFNRSGDHYTSHKYWPFDHLTKYSTLALSDKVGLIGFPIGSTYYDKGYWIYRSAFEKLLDNVLPSRLVETNAPLSTEVTVTYQTASEELNRKERYMVHIVNWSATRKAPPHSEMFEDPIALTDIKIKLNIPLQNVTVKTAVSGIILQHRSTGDGIEVTIPRILIHEIVCFEQF